jgi:hypothetical protein
MRVVDKDVRVADNYEKTACAGYCHIEALRVGQEANVVFHVDAHHVERAPHSGDDDDLTLLTLEHLSGADF